MLRNWKRKIIGGLCFSSALFVFQACYGTGPDFRTDMLIEGQVKSKTTGLPINGIMVSVPENFQFTRTGENGNFSLYTYYIGRSLMLEFTDTDSIQNGYYAKKDTLLEIISKEVHIDVSLEDK